MDAANARKQSNLNRLKQVLKAIEEQIDYGNYGYKYHGEAVNYLMEELDKLGYNVEYGNDIDSLVVKW